MSLAGRRPPQETTVAHRPLRPPRRRFYVVGGNLHPDDPSYVERQADHDLYEGLRRGEFCYVLTARQMGKSSLMVRTAARLRADGVAVAVVDLTGIGRNLTVEQWYDGLLRHIAEDLDREAELEAFWKAHPRLGPMQRWVMALREVVLLGAGVPELNRDAQDEQDVSREEALPFYPVDPGPVPCELSRTPERPPSFVIFIDEIDAVRSLPFSTDEFFAGIRECYNRRATDPAFQRLTFCLLGVATPGDLVQDTRTTPFNIGRRIELTDFTEAEAAPLALGLTGGTTVLHGEGGRKDRVGVGVGVGADPLTPTPTPTPTPTRKRSDRRGDPAQVMLRRILHWTGGHPCLTQRLCEVVATEQSAAPCPNPKSKIQNPKSVDRVCRRLFLADEARERDDNLIFVRDYLLRNDADPAALLELYARVRRGRLVRDDATSRLVSILRLSGLVRPLAGRLRVRNRIYARAFDRQWITEHMPEAERRRQRAAYRRGLWRAAAISVTVLAVVASFALDALFQARRADRNAQAAADRARDLRVALQEAREQRDRADRAARQEKITARSERFHRLHAEAARRKADRESRRATQQQQIAEAHQAEAEQERRRERRARRDATEKLWLSYLAEARARRFSGRTGRRFRALEVLAKAAAIRPSLALRNEAIASMALADIRLENRLITRPETAGIAIDHRYTRYAYVDRHGGISIHRLSDNRKSLSLPGVGGPYYGGPDFSNTGRFMYVEYGSPPNKIFPCVWDLTGPRLVLKLDPGLALSGRQSFSPDDRWIAVGCMDGSIRLYELPSGREIRRLSPGPPIYSLHASPDGRQLAVSSSAARTVQVRDIDTGRVVQSLLHPASVTRADWSPDGRLLASACGDARVYVWDAETGQPVRTLEGHKLAVRDVRFSHRGDLLASWTWDETFRVWDPFGGREMASVQDMLARGSFSPDDRVVGHANTLWLPGSRRGGQATLTLLALVPGAECRTLYTSMDRTETVATVEFSPDGRLLAAGSRRGVHLWEAATGKKLDSRPSGGVHSISFESGGKSLITAGDQSLDHWPIEPGRATRPVQFGSSRRLGSANPWASLSGNGRILVSVQAGRVRVLDRADPSREQFYDGPPNTQKVAISPDGRWLAASTGPGDIPLTEERTRVWDLQQPGAGRDLPIRGRARLAFSPDSRWLVVGGIQEYRFWRTGNWQPGLRIPRQSRGFAPGPAVFSRDGGMLAIARTPQLAQIVDPTDGKELATLEVPNPGTLTWFAFSPDGSRLAAATEYGWVHLWDLGLIRRQLRAMGLDWGTPRMGWRHGSTLAD
jgi:WD40 repeat protein